MVSGELAATVVRIVIDGDARIVREQITDLAWIIRFHVQRSGNRSIWTLTIDARRQSPTDLLRIVLADRRLRIVEFQHLAELPDRETEAGPT